MKNLMLFVLWCVSLPVWAATIDPRIAKADVCGTYVVAHVNGINTDQDGALANLQAIRDAYGNAYDEHLIVYRLAYNQTRGFAQDVIDSYRQIAALYPPITFQDFLTAFATAIFSAFWPGDVVEGVRQALRELFTLEEPLMFYEQDLRSMVLAISPTARTRLLLVGHSQGTLYANMLYDRFVGGYDPGNGGPGARVIGAQAMAIVAVAAVTQDVRRGTHVTSEHDVVVNGVRFVYPNTLWWTTQLPAEPDGGLGHNLRDIYLEYAAGSITSEMTIGLESLRVYPPTTYQGYPVDMWLHTRGAGYTVCGPIDGRPPPDGPCFTIGAVWTAPIVSYTIPGSPTPGVRYGSESELENLAQAGVVGCQALFVARFYEIFQQGGDPRSRGVDVPGCGGISRQGEDYMAWIIHSSDGIGVRFRQYSPDQVYADGHASCRAPL